MNSPKYQAGKWLVSCKHFRVLVVVDGMGMVKSAPSPLKEFTGKPMERLVGFVKPFGEATFLWQEMETQQQKGLF